MGSRASHKTLPDGVEWGGWGGRVGGRWGGGGVGGRWGRSGEGWDVVEEASAEGQDERR